MFGSKGPSDRRELALPTIILWGARFAFLSALVILTVLALLSNQNMDDVGQLIPWDKASHFIAYFVLTCIGLVAWPRLSVLRLGGLVFVYGLGLELVQPIFGREQDIGDLIANGIGILSACGPLFLGWLRRALEEHG